MRKMCARQCSRNWARGPATLTFTAWTSHLTERPGAKVIIREIIVACNHVGASNPNAPITTALALLAGAAGCVSVYWNPYMSCGIAAKLPLEAALPAVDWKAEARA